MERTSRRQFLSAALKVAGGLALASCAPAAPTAAPASGATGAAASGGPKRGGMLLIADRADNKTVDPAYINDTPARLIGRAGATSTTTAQRRRPMPPRHQRGRPARHFARPPRSPPGSATRVRFAPAPVSR